MMTALLVTIAVGLLGLTGLVCLDLWLTRKNKLVINETLLLLVELKRKHIELTGEVLAKVKKLAGEKD